MNARDELLKRFPQLVQTPLAHIEAPAEPSYDVVKKHFTLPFELYPFQVDAVNELAYRPRSGLYLDTGCVDSETEYLSETGWKRIADYSGGRVAQYNLDGSIEFVEPTEFIKKPCDSMIRISTKYGVDQMLSPEHRVLYKSVTTEHLHVISARSLAERHWSVPQGFRGKFMTTFKAPDYKGLPISDADLRLQVAIIADGHFPNKGNRVTVRVKKGRKQQRLASLLVASGRDLKVSACVVEGFMRFYFYAPMRCKEFGPEFYQCSRQQLAIIADEFRYWDGCVKGKRVSFSTTSKQSADFIQYACAASGVRSVVNSVRRDEPYRNKPFTEHTVNLNSRSPHASINSADAHDNVRVVPSSDGYKYCFSVPSTYLILRRNGCIFATGNTGKSITSTVMALYKLHQGADIVIVLMPPILIPGWVRSLSAIPEISVKAYRGTPKERKQIQFDADFVCMSYQIFKLDYERIRAELQGRRVVVVADEATAIKNPGSDNHRKVFDFVVGQDVMLLTGTPLSKPEDAYAYCKIVAPGTYRNMAHFSSLHIDEVDFFGNVVSYKNLDLLAENMKINAVRVLKEDVLKDLPPITYTPLYYDLAPAHERLYHKLAEEQLLRLTDGGKIDATTPQALYHALGQIITNYGYFSQDERNIAAGIELLEEQIEELEGRKLVVFTNYRLTNGFLTERLKPYKAQMIYGGTSQKQNEVSLDTFINDKACRCIVMNCVAGGFGLDGLQHVANDVMFLEIPPVPAWFHQAAARLHRAGQHKNVQVRVAVANRTCNVRQFKQLMDKDALVNRVVRGVQDLRDAIHGN